MSARQDQTKMDNYYEILSLNNFEHDTTAIRKAYLNAAKQHHPDKHQGNDETFKLVKKAYEVLTDPNRREVYDIELMLANSIAATNDRLKIQNSPAIKVYTQQVTDHQARYYNPSHGYRYKLPSFELTFRDGFIMTAVENVNKSNGDISAKIPPRAFSQYDQVAHLTYFKLKCSSVMLSTMGGDVVGLLHYEEHDKKMHLTLVNKDLSPEDVKEWINAFNINQPSYSKSDFLVNIKIDKILLVDRLKALEEVSRLRAKKIGWGAEEKIQKIERALERDNPNELRLALEHQRHPAAIQFFSGQAQSLRNFEEVIDKSKEGPGL